MIKTLNDFNIFQIADSGQCFRMEIPDADFVRLAAADRYLEIRVLSQSDDGSSQTCDFSCPEDEFDGFWSSYFDLETDYAAVKKRIPSDDIYLSRAAAAGGGIRILKQDLWEMVISFIISQQNNIPRIRKSISAICERYGNPIPGSPRLYDFPPPEALAFADEDALRSCGLGYRAKYVLKVSRDTADGTLDLARLRGFDYASAREELMKCYGIGVKVADCIALFSLHHVEAFPVDTHIRQVMAREYPDGFPFELYESCAGIIQQYIFYYELLRQKGLA